MSGSSIWDAIDDFLGAFDAIKVPKPVEDPYIQTTRIQATITCLKDDHGTLDATFYVSTMWKDLSGLHYYNAVSDVDTRIRHGMTMFGTHSSFAWLTRVINDTVKKLDHILVLEFEKKTWIQKLVTDIYDAICKRSGDRTPTFIPQKYLPDSTAEQTTISLAKIRFTTKKEIVLPHVRKFCRLLLKTWLGFPLGDIHECRYLVMQAFINCAPPDSNGFFLLTDSWTLFSEPTKYLALVDGKPTRLSSENIYDLVYSVLSGHRIFKPNTPEASYLETLDFLTHRWSSDTGPAHTKQHFLKTRSRKNIAILPDQEEDTAVMQGSQEVRSDVFLTWLRGILPLVQPAENETATTPYSLDTSKQTDPILHKIQQRPDFYLPFRDRAPTRQHVMGTIYNNTETLRTPQGFWSVLAHRGVFYGSDFEFKERKSFNHIDEWKAFKATSSKPDSYFANPNAFGTAISQRSIHRLQEYWDTAQLEWPTFLADHPGALKFREVYDFLRASTKNKNFGKPLHHGHRNKKGASKRDRQSHVLDNREKSPRFYGIGGLIATLICGDLVLAGLITMPSPEEMGQLVKELKMGALAGLQKLGLTSDVSSKGDICNAFSELSRHLDSHLSPI